MSRINATVVGHRGVPRLVRLRCLLLRRHQVPLGWCERPGGLKSREAAQAGQPPLAARPRCGADGSRRTGLATPQARPERGGPELWTAGSSTWRRSRSTLPGVRSSVAGASSSATSQWRASLGLPASRARSARSAKAAGASSIGKSQPGAPTLCSQTPVESAASASLIAASYPASSATCATAPSSGRSRAEASRPSAAPQASARARPGIAAASPP